MRIKPDSLGIILGVTLLLLSATIFLFNRNGILSVFNKNILSESESIKINRNKGHSEEELLDLNDSALTLQTEELNPDNESILPIEEKFQKARLYFIEVDSAGNISLSNVFRDIKDTGTPLTDAIKSLIEGPITEELNRSLLNMIPKGTILHSARIENNTAYLDLSENFRFNSLGIEGYVAQLNQIIYTATEFYNVSLVQIIIEGRKVEYLGAEGIYIGEALSRESFK